MVWFADYCSARSNTSDSLLNTMTLEKPALMLGWVGTKQDSPFGIWVLENPIPSQLQIFKDAGFPYESQAYFTPSDLMEQAGATFYDNIRDSAAAKKWLRSPVDNADILPSLMFGFKKGAGPAGYVLRNPTKKQIQVFRDADYPYAKMALCADSGLLERAGAVYYPDMNKVSEFAIIILAGMSRKQRRQMSIFGWPKTGGVWAVISPTEEQFQRLEDLGYPFDVYDQGDEYHGLLKKVGAVFHKNPEDVAAEVEKVSPGFVLMRTGERGGRAVD